MARRMTRLTVDTLRELPLSVRTSLTWELDPVSRSRLDGDEAAVAEKEAWLSAVLLEWGSCGRVLYVDDAVAGMVLYAPPAFFAGSDSYPTAPVSEDAVQLATAYVVEPLRGQGLGRLLMQAMVKDLLKRDGIRAVECFGSSGIAEDPDCLPEEFLARVGFRTHRPHPRTPRMRLELRSILSWRSELEVAVERLLGAVRPGRTAPAAPSAPRVSRRTTPPA